MAVVARSALDLVVEQEPPVGQVGREVPAALEDELASSLYVQDRSAAVRSRNAARPGPGKNTR